MKSKASWVFVAYLVVLLIIWKAPKFVKQPAPSLQGTWVQVTNTAAPGDLVSIEFRSDGTYTASTTSAHGFIRIINWGTYLQDGNQVQFSVTDFSPKTVVDQAVSVPKTWEMSISTLEPNTLTTVEGRVFTRRQSSGTTLPAGH